MKRAEAMKMTFDLPKLRLIKAEDLYDQPSNIDFGNPSLDFNLPSPDLNPALQPENIPPAEEKKE